MARKTLEEKQVSDARHLYRFEEVIKPTLKLQSTTRQLHSSDLSNTVLITGLILAAQLILFFTLKNHFIRIPGISY